MIAQALAAWAGLSAEVFQRVSPLLPALLCFETLQPAPTEAAD
jgi:hypothetical protein